MTAIGYASSAMAGKVKRGDMDNAVRQRWRAWLRYYRNERLRADPGESETAFAAWLEVSQSAVNLALRHNEQDARGPGIDLIIKLSDKTGMSLDTMCRKHPSDVYPQPKDPRPRDHQAKERSGERKPNPGQASSG